jgi:hypothetical protein
MIDEMLYRSQPIILGNRASHRVNHHHLSFLFLCNTIVVLELELFFLILQ